MHGALARAGRAIAETLRRPWVVLPLLVVAALAAPSLPYMLPSYRSELSEDYQPLMALKFYASFGQEFSKYGPMSNLLLGPSYALSMAWWWLDGSFSRPSGDFPYGFADPIRQISWLLLHGRALFMLLFLGLAAYALQAMRALTANTAAIMAAFLFCVGTDYAVAINVANTRPDGPMFAFVLASLGVYARIVADGLTRARGVWLSLLAVCAISSKEIAGPVYLLPYLGLGLAGWRRTRGDAAARRAFAEAAGLSLAAGVGSYLVLNVIYAPKTWLLRMEHWLVAEGTDSAVWGGVASGALSYGEYLLRSGEAFLNTLGPGGLPVVALALVVLCVRRPANWLLLLLPALSGFLFGVLPLGYVGDYFHAVPVLALFPAVCVGLAELFALARGGASGLALRVGVAAALAANLCFATFAWHRLDGLEQRMIERSLAELPLDGRSVNVLHPSPHVPGMSRLDWLGHRVDPSSLQQLMDAPREQRPDRLYVTAGLLSFVTNAKRFEARAEVLRGLGTDVRDWEGPEALGYRRVAELVPTTPWWYPFDRMPAVRSWRELNPILVYERTPSPGAQ